MKKRLLGFQQALEEYGVPYQEQNIFEGQIDYRNGISLAKNSFPKSSQRRQSSARLIFWQSVPSVGFMRRGCACRRTTP